MYEMPTTPAETLAARLQTLEDVQDDVALALGGSNPALAAAIVAPYITLLEENVNDPDA